jgi:hypothetical protein
MTQPTYRLPILYRAWAWGIAAGLAGGVLYTYTTALWSEIYLIKNRPLPQIVGQILFALLVAPILGSALGILLSIMPAFASALALNLFAFVGFFEPRATRRHYLILCVTSATIASIGVLLELHVYSDKGAVTVVSLLVIAISAAIGWWVAHHIFRNRNWISSQGQEELLQNESIASSQPRLLQIALRRFVVQTFLVFSIITLIELALYWIS